MTRNDGVPSAWSGSGHLIRLPGRKRDDHTYCPTRSVMLTLALISSALIPLLPRISDLLILIWVSNCLWTSTSHAKYALRESSDRSSGCMSHRHFDRVFIYLSASSCSQSARKWRAHLLQMSCLFIIWYKVNMPCNLEHLRFFIYDVLLFHITTHGCS
jgi:hypothetical protein